MLNDLPKEGASAMLGGYQQDHPLILMADTQCHIDGRFVDATGRLLLRHTCAGTRGVSGAPLLIDCGGGWHVAAIEVASEIGIVGGAAVILNEAVKSALMHE